MPWYSGLCQACILGHARRVAAATWLSHAADPAPYSIIYNLPPACASYLDGIRFAEGKRGRVCGGDNAQRARERSSLAV